MGSEEPEGSDRLNRRTGTTVPIVTIVTITILLVAPTVPVVEKAPTIYPNHVIVHELKSPTCWIFDWEFTYSDGTLTASCQLIFV